MFKHNISYVDFNGAERKEDFYFHLSLPEVTRIEAKIGNSIEKYTKELSAQMDMEKLLEFLEMMILSSYGRKTLDGRSFHKSKELRSEFENSQAYAEFFEELLLQPELAQRFGAGVADKGKSLAKRVQA